MNDLEAIVREWEPEIDGLYREGYGSPNDLFIESLVPEPPPPGPVKNTYRVPPNPNRRSS